MNLSGFGGGLNGIINLASLYVSQTYRGHSTTMPHSTDTNEGYLGAGSGGRPSTYLT